MILTYLLTAIGFTHGGSSTVHIYTQTIHRTIQNKQYIEQHKRYIEQAALNFFLNRILICQGCSQILELFHLLKGSVILLTCCTYCWCFEFGISQELLGMSKENCIFLTWKRIQSHKARNYLAFC